MAHGQLAAQGWFKQIAYKDLFKCEFSSRMLQKWVQTVPGKHPRKQIFNISQQVCPPHGANEKRTHDGLLWRDWNYRFAFVVRVLTLKKNRRQRGSTENASFFLNNWNHCRSPQRRRMNSFPNTDSLFKSQITFYSSVTIKHRFRL